MASWGTPVDARGLRAGESVDFEIWCGPAVGGTEGLARLLDNDDTTVVREFSGVSGAEPDVGLEAGEVNALCDRARVARTAHTVEGGSIRPCAGRLSVRRSG